MGLGLGRGRFDSPNPGGLLPDDPTCQHWHAHPNDMGVPDRFVLWFGMLFIGGVDKKIIALAFVSGLAYVLTFIDGVGSISRYQTSDNGFAIGMYAMGQSINWLGAIAWAVFIVALVKGKSWTYPLGLFAASMSIFGGLPVGVTDVIMEGRFSMFLVSPLMSMALLAYFLFPSTHRMIEAWNGSSSSPTGTLRD